MTGDFDTRDNNWDPLYPYHSVHTNTVHKVADNFGLKMLTLINLVLI